MDNTRELLVAFVKPKGSLSATKVGQEMLRPKQTRAPSEGSQWRRRKKRRSTGLRGPESKEAFKQQSTGAKEMASRAGSLSALKWPAAVATALAVVLLAGDALANKNSSEQSNEISPQMTRLNRGESMFSERKFSR